MPIPLIVGGVTYQYPSTTDEGWGSDATKWAVAITQGTLQKAGGLFALTADLDFGPNFGIKSIYYKSRSSGIALSGQVRLANNEFIAFRNFGATGDLAFGPGSSDAIPQWNSVDLVNLSTAQTLTNKTLTSAILDNPIFTGLPTLSGLTLSNCILTNSTVSDNLIFGTAKFDALMSFILVNNQSSPTVLFTFPLPGNENIIVEYSINRNGSKECGNLFITTDGSVAQVAPGSLNLAITGVDFTADVSGGLIRLKYTTTSTGFSATMKYLTRRWAD